jgi:Tfp pilus assembly protein PilX
MLLYEKNNIKGFALITVLLFMQILALLGLYAIRHALLANKMNQAHYQHFLLLNKADTALDYAETNAPGCEIPIINSQELIKRPLAFWRSLSCGGIFPGFQYYYVTESLGEDPCADILYQNTTASYFRVTALTISNDNTAKIFLQSIIVKPSTVTNICKGSHHIVTQGRETWRILE